MPCVLRNPTLIPAHRSQYGVDAWVEIAGKRAEEYKVRVPVAGWDLIVEITVEDEVVKCYIISEAGQPYKLASTCPRSLPNGIDAWAVVDGNKHRRKIVYSGQTTRNEGPLDNESRLHPYQFAPALLTGELSWL